VCECVRFWVCVRVYVCAYGCACKSVFVYANICTYMYTYIRNIYTHMNVIYCVE